MELWTKTSRHFSTNGERENRLIYLFWEKQWQKALFDKRGGILCDTEKGDKSAQREIWDFYARMARPHACRFARGFCRDAGNITSDISHIIKKDPTIGFVSGALLYFWFDCVCGNEVCWKAPCDRVRIGCAFALFLIVFEARKPVAKDPAIGFVSGAPLHFWFGCVWSNEAST